MKFQPILAAACLVATAAVAQERARIERITMEPVAANW